MNESGPPKIFKLPPPNDLLPRRLSVAATGAVENVLRLRRLDRIYGQIGRKGEVEASSTKHWRD